MNKALLVWFAAVRSQLGVPRVPRPSQLRAASPLMVAAGTLAIP
ncbi:hypothetical protein [Advenella incenata]|nr:hypothetical protein [Advenella incenata]